MQKPGSQTTTTANAIKQLKKMILFGSPLPAATPSIRYLLYFTMCQASKSSKKTALAKKEEKNKNKSWKKSAKNLQINRQRCRLRC